MKLCAKCGAEKPLDEFYRNSRNASGVGSYCKPCNSPTAEQHRKRHLRAAYGITPEQYDAMATRQDSRCAICNEFETKTTRRCATVWPLSVDHDHVTGKVRELLCDRCNGLLGKAKDDPALLHAAAEYLERHSANGAS